MDDSANRRLILGGLGGLALGAAAPAHAQPAVRRDLYNGELDYLAKEFSGAATRIPSRIQIAGASEPGERMAMSGRTLSWRTGEPVPGVIIYVYHTDATGSYDGGPAGTRHARLRGWVRTGADGVYSFTSIKPATYPDRSMPAHIHLTVLEPGKPPYWIDDIVFDGEYRVDAAYKAKMEKRGGNGVTALTRENGVWTGVRDIRLERHPA